MAAPILVLCLICSASVPDISRHYRAFHPGMPVSALACGVTAQEVKPVPPTNARIQRIDRMIREGWTHHRQAAAEHGDSSALVQGLACTLAALADIRDELKEPLERIPDVR